MNSWIRIFFSFFLVLEVGACDFSSQVGNVYSLSGPVTVALRDMGFLKNPKLKGISLFNPVSKFDFAGRVFPGGVFLSQGVTQEFTGSVLFYDQSRELSKVLSPMSSVQSIEVITRGLTPIEVTDKVINILHPLLKNCDQELVAWKKKSTDLSERIIRLLNLSEPVVFFLGDFKNDRSPETIIVNDGIVKWLIEKKKVTTYPSSLAYVNWSARLMAALPKKHLKLALVDSSRSMVKAVKKRAEGLTLIYPGVLVPGVTQLEAINFLIDSRGH